MSVKVDLSRALSDAYEQANVETLNEAVVLFAVAETQMKAGGAAGNRPSNDRAQIPRPPSSCVGIVGDLLARYFPENLAWATRIVKRESNCTPTAVNWREGCDTSGRTNSHAEGLFQLCWPQHQSLIAVGCSDPLDAECNVRMARRLYDSAGAGPWGG